MGSILAFANQKGGVGKTTSAVNIAAALGQAGKNTLLIDSDPQGNASSGVGVNKKALDVTLYDVLIGASSAKDAVIRTPYENLSVLPSGMALAGAEIELIDTEKREQKLKNALGTVRDSYDYLIVDCPPSLGMLTVNALTAADGVVIPMQAEYYALEGLSQLMLSIRQVKKLYHPALEITGILLTMYNNRLNLSVSVRDELVKYYGDKLFETTIPRVVRLSEAPSYGTPGVCYDRNGKGSEAYRSVAAELMKRI